MMHFKSAHFWSDAEIAAHCDC